MYVCPDIYDPDLLKKVITGDGLWMYAYDIESKTQSSQWKRTERPRPKKALQVRSNVKVFRVVHHYFLPQGRTVNKEYLIKVMRRLWEAIRQKRIELWKNQS